MAYTFVRFTRNEQNDWINVLSLPQSEALKFLEYIEKGELAWECLLTTLDMKGYGIINVATPINPNDAVNKAYADSLISGLSGLSGDVTAIGPGISTAVVNSVGGSSATNIHTAEQSVNAATSANTPSGIVRRDSFGNFAAGTIIANLTGQASQNANLSLNNLGTVAFNSDLLPNADSTRSLGSALLRLKYVYAELIKNSQQRTVLDTELYHLNDNSGTTVLDFSNGLDVKFQRIQNITNPQNPQDAATKAYVDALTSSGGGGGTNVKIASFTLTPSNILSKSIALASIPMSPTSTTMNVVGGIPQSYSDDFTVSGNILSWSGLGLDGLLTSGDKIIVQFF